MAYDDHVEEIFRLTLKQDEQERMTARSLWDLVKGQLDEYKLLEIAEQFPRFAEEARNLAEKVVERNARERRAEDDMRAIGNDRL